MSCICSTSITIFGGKHLELGERFGGRVGEEAERTELEMGAGGWSFRRVVQKGIWAQCETLELGPHSGGSI